MHREVSKPKILFFDIETAGVNALKSDLGFVLMVGYKWAHEKAVKIVTIKKKHLRHFDDREVLTTFSKIYEQADIVVAHFGSVFDRRFLQGRLLIHSLPPLPQTVMRDTCMIARSVANFSSNRLGNLGITLDLSEKKIEKGNGWPTWWFKAMQGDMNAVRAMALYCKGDVLALEKLYYRLLPFDNAHPRLHVSKLQCGSCGSKVERRGYRVAKTRRYARYQCLNASCQKWGQGEAA
jgi:uncharacterized protein YprB with RNaseH-like and TPR domain